MRDSAGDVAVAEWHLCNAIFEILHQMIEHNQIRRWHGIDSDGFLFLFQFYDYYYYNTRSRLLSHPPMPFKRLCDGTTMSTTMTQWTNKRIKSVVCVSACLCVYDVEQDSRFRLLQAFSPMATIPPSTTCIWLEVGAHTNHLLTAVVVIFVVSFYSDAQRMEAKRAKLSHKNKLMLKMNTSNGSREEKNGATKKKGKMGESFHSLLCAVHTLERRVGTAGLELGLDMGGETECMCFCSAKCMMVFVCCDVVRAIRRNAWRREKCKGKITSKQSHMHAQECKWKEIRHCVLHIVQQQCEHVSRVAYLRFRLSCVLLCCPK